MLTSRAGGDQAVQHADDHDLPPVRPPHNAGLAAGTQGRGCSTTPQAMWTTALSGAADKQVDCGR